MTDRRDAHTAVSDLAGKRAVVTGGTTGIGRAIAVLLAEQGARVFICGRDPDHLQDALDRIREVGEGDGISLDMAEADNVRRFMDAGRDAMGGIDIVVANAAVAAGALGKTDEATLRRVIATDFTAYLLTAHAALDLIDGDGDIVLIGSMSAHVLGGGSTVYAGIKAGIAGFSEALRREVGERGIRVILIEPGKTGADMQKPDLSEDELREMIADETVLRAEDIAVGVHYALTQPRRTVVQQLTIVPRAQTGE